MEPTAAARRRAYGFCVLAMVGWGSNFVASKIVYQSISGLTLLFLRYLIALAILLAVYRKTPRPRLTGAERRNILLIGVFGYCLANGLQMMGMKLAAASMASIINTITPVAILLFAVPVLRERPTAAQAFGVAVTVAGSIIIVGGAGGGSSPLGIALSFVGMALWGLASVLIRRSCSNVSGIWITIYGTLAAMLTDIPFALLEVRREGVNLDSLLTWEFLAALLWIGAVATAGANLWWNQALAVLPAATCSLFYALLPLVTTLLGWAILGERPTGKFLVGCLVIIAGVMIAIRRKQPAAQDPCIDT